MTTETTNYLVGNFAPDTDELTATDLPVEGAIPPGLNGPVPSHPRGVLRCGRRRSP